MKRALAFGPVFIVLWAPRTLLAVENPPASTTGPASQSPTPYDPDSSVPRPAPPITRAPQQIDPDVPPPPAPRPSSVLPPGPLTGPNEALLVAGELLVASFTISGVGVAGYYAISYAPPSPDVPRSTAASTALNLGGLAALIVGPALVGRLVCAIGRLSVDYEGGCGATIGSAYGAGLVLTLLADSLTAHAPPPTCDECATTHSGPAALVGYIAGVSLGAVIAWNLWKHRKDETLAFQPITRAAQPPAALADWTEPLLRSSDRSATGSGGREVPLIALAF